MNKQGWATVLLGSGALACLAFLYQRDLEPDGQTPVASPSVGHVDSPGEDVIEGGTVLVGEVEAQSADPVLASDQPPLSETTSIRPGFARLDIELLSEEDGEPMKAMRLLLETTLGSDFPDVSYNQPAVAAHKGTPWRILLSDLHGRATFSVPAGIDLVLHVWDEIDSDLRKTLAIPRLMELEERDLALEFRTRPDTPLHIRVYPRWRERGEFQGAVVSVMSEGRTMRSTKTDKSGECWTWSQSGRGDYLYVEAPGFTPVFAPVSTGDFESSAVQVIQLLASGTFWFEAISSAGLPLPDVVCTVLIEPQELVQMRHKVKIPGESLRIHGTTNENGSLQLSVPVQAEFSIEIRCPWGLVLRPQEKFCSYINGDDLYSFEASDMLRLEGTLSNQGGEAVAGKTMWAVPADMPGRRILTCMDCADLKFPFGDPKHGLWKSKTAADGRFLFSKIPEGTYLVGPSPECTKSDLNDCGASGNSQSMAPLGTTIQVFPGGTNHIDLVIDQGLYLTGRVVDSSGDPRQGALVRIAHPQLVGARFESLTTAGGVFRFGPLKRGNWRIVASMDHMRSKPIHRQPGGEELVLELARGVRGRAAQYGEVGSIRGVLVRHPTQELPSVRRVEIYALKATMELEPLALGQLNTSTNEFLFRDLAPGAYVLQAHFEGGSAHMNVILPSGGVDIFGVEIYVGPLAQVRLRPSKETNIVEPGARGANATPWTYTLRSGTDFVLRGVFWGWESDLLSVPEGFVDVVATRLDRKQSISMRGEATFDEVLDLVF